MKLTFRILALVVAAASGSGLRPAGAAEYGLTNYQLGLVLPLAGYTPPPGVYFWSTFYHYLGSGALYQNAKLPSPDRVTYNFAANIVNLAWFTDVRLFGGELGFATTNAYGSDTTTVVHPFVDAFGVGRHSTLQQETNGFADSELSAILGWQAGNHHWSVTLTGFAPTGSYKARRISQTSLNRPAADIKGAYTFLSLETGLEATGALGVMVNGSNAATMYQSGAELHFEWTIAQHFPFGLAAGVGGYFYQQITPDGGAGDVHGSFRGRVAAVGPIITYSLRSGEQQVDFDARWFHEFNVENRVRGDAILATLCFPLKANPPAVMATRN